MMEFQKWKVYKFGGTSLQHAAAFRCVADIVVAASLCHDGSNHGRMGVVVSAMGGKPKVTDMLLDVVTAAEGQDEEACASALKGISARHVACIHELLDEGQLRSDTEAAVLSDIEDLSDILRAIRLTRFADPRLRALISGYGEVWSARILTALLGSRGYQYGFVDARRCLVVKESPLARASPVVDFNETTCRVRAELTALGSSATHGVVITGYVACTADGVATTLKRNGSDFSASIFGKVLGADDVTIWTDVSGVLSADPRRVPTASILSNISFKEASELAYFGAKVIHPSTMAPAISAGIPIFIRNTFEPEHPGTKIDADGDQSHRTTQRGVLRGVKAFSSVDDVALVDVQGCGMLGVPGIAERLFGALHRVDVNVVMIAQASSEQSICVAIPASQANVAVGEIRKAFTFELGHGEIETVALRTPCSIVAAVGDAMAFTPGVSGRFFGALGDAGINVMAISQGSSERNISAVVAGADSARALQACHAAFVSPA